MTEGLHFRAFRVHRWVLWWFYVGVVCGIVAVSTIFLRDLTRTQEHILIFLGVMHWLLGGLVCWACEGIQTTKSSEPHLDRREPVEDKPEWHEASEFLLPGTGHHLLPPSRSQESRERLDFYLIQRRQQRR